MYPVRSVPGSFIEKRPRFPEYGSGVSALAQMETLARLYSTFWAAAKSFHTNGSVKIPNSSSPSEAPSPSVSKRVGDVP
jgi:hypothetical protein